MSSFFALFQTDATDSLPMFVSDTREPTQPTLRSRLRPRAECEDLGTLPRLLRFDHPRFDQPGYRRDRVFERYPEPFAPDMHPRQNQMNSLLNPDRWDVTDPGGRGAGAVVSDLYFLAVCYDDDMAPAHAASALAQSWHASIMAVR